MNIKWVPRAYVSSSHIIQYKSAGKWKSILFFVFVTTHMTRITYYVVSSVKSSDVLELPADHWFSWSSIDHIMSFIALVFMTLVRRETVRRWKLKFVFFYSSIFLRGLEFVPGVLLTNYKNCVKAEGYRLTSSYFGSKAQSHIKHVDEFWKCWKKHSHY